MANSTSTASDDMTTDTVDSSSSSATWEGSGSGEPIDSSDPNAYMNDRDLQEIWSANGGE